MRGKEKLVEIYMWYLKTYTNSVVQYFVHLHIDENLIEEPINELFNIELVNITSTTSIMCSYLIAFRCIKHMRTRVNI